MMNRSFRAQESQMQAALRQRQQKLKEKDDELALFLEMKNREKERNDLLLLRASSEDFGADNAAAALGI